MSTTLAQLAQLLGGTLAGDGSCQIHGAAPRREVRAGELTFVDKADKVGLLAGTPAAAALVPRGVEVPGLPVIQVDQVQEAFGRVVSLFRPRRAARRVGISPLAHVSPTARIGPDVTIHPGASIGDDVEIGAGCTIHGGVQIMAGCQLGQQVTIYPNAVLYEDTVVGDRSTIHACAVLGADGFGYKLVQGRHCLSAQLGNVVLGSDVDVGAGTTIDRGTYSATRVGDGTKLDDQVMIGHNCQIGKHVLICAQVGIAGSVTVGDYTVIAGQAGIRDHVTIGRQVVLGAMSGVMSDVPDGAQMLGIPATEGKEQLLLLGSLAKLPEMRRQLKALQRQVDQLRPGTSQTPAAA